MPFTSEQDSFIIMAHFRSGTRNADGLWSYSLQSCIEQFTDAFPDLNARMERSPHKSVANLAAQTGISYGTCQKAHDYAQRVQYCQWFMESLNNDYLLDRTFMSDEAWFHLSGYVNSQNYRTWATENPHNYVFYKYVLQVRDRQHSFSAATWTKLYNNRVTDREDLENEDDTDDQVYSKWSELPDLLLEKIFSYLSMRQKYYASLVCSSWYRAFYLPGVWSQFVLEDSTLTRGRFNYYSGWQYVLDHLRTQMCLSQVGRYFRHLTFDPMLNFYNLYEFMNMVSWYIEQTSKDVVKTGVGTNIRSLKFTFPCNMSNRDETERIRLFGTGGKLLDALKRLMGNLKKLKQLELIDLMLDQREAQHLLDGVCETCCLTLRILILVNTTRVQYQILHAGIFLNLQVLIISPQNLGDDMVELLGYTALQHLHIVQNRYTPNDSTIKPVSAKAWKVCRINNPKLHVHLQVQSIKDKQLIWQERAPVNSILYDSPSIGLQTDSAVTAIELYKKDLHIYGHQSLPRFYRPKSFHERIDSSLLLVCRQCPFLKILVVTERVSTATILLLAHTARNLKYLYIRGNAVIKRCDWPQSPEWSDEFYEWMKFNSRSYVLVEKEVSQILGYTWQMLTDKQFKNLNINLHNESLL